MKFRVAFWFILLEALSCLFVFRNGIWGGSLLAPVDIAPALFSKYKFVDPTSSGIPANHYDIDQILADLPLQYTMYQAYRRGEIPWWDPYTYSGMPMIADGHASGTDFSRLILYQLLPFVAAYNWTRIVHFVLLGLGMLLLLRRFEIEGWIAVPLAITFQFAGIFALEFQHPWIESSFLYYPFLWLAWDAYSRRRDIRYVVIGAALVAAICYSGSIQTQAYLGIFGLAFLFGYAGLNRAELRRILPCVVLSGIVGACLAAPILFNQAELFFLSAREVAIRSPLTLLSGVGSLTAFYPWCLGTFRTLDLGKLVGQNSLGFNLFIGTAGAVLAVFGGFSRTGNSTAGQPKRTAVVLIAAYFVIMSTPLFNIFYIRCAGLPAMGMVVLMGFGLKGLFGSNVPLRRAGLAVLVSAIIIGVATNVAAKYLYPRYLPEVRRVMAEHERKHLMPLDRAPALREFQVRNLPHEVSFENPEVLLGWLGLFGVGIGLLRPELRAKKAFWFALLILNLLPVLSFACRYIPRSEIALWRRLLEGGPEQQRVMKACGDSPERLTEVAPGIHELLFPGAMAHLYGVRVTHGYTGLVPRTLLIVPGVQTNYGRWLGDWVYESKERGEQTGSLHRKNEAGLARFDWRGDSKRNFTIKDKSLTEIEAVFEPGPRGKLLRTDTFHPGWLAEADGRQIPVEFVKPCFSEIEVPENATRIVWRYRPRFLTAGLVLVFVGVLFTGFCALIGKGRSATNERNVG